jgi:DNA-binding transcriptional regulator YhcF (GntR family)
LVLLIAESDPGTAVTKIALPKLRDMADMTNLAAETVSRAISELRRHGLLQRDGHRRAAVAVKDLSVFNFPLP